MYRNHLGWSEWALITMTGMLTHGMQKKVEKRSHAHTEEKETEQRGGDCSDAVIVQEMPSTSGTYQKPREEHKRVSPL